MSEGINWLYLAPPMEYGISWEADSHSVLREIPHLLRDPEVDYRDHKSMPLDPLSIQMSQFHTLSPYSFKIRFNNILPFKPTSPNCSLILLISD
jgi:hypothetical protein